MDDEKTSSEPIRGCGFRQVGKLYLVGEGIEFACPSLPLIFKPCDCCGYEPPQYRDFQWIAKAYIKHIREPTGVACDPGCPVCYGVNDQNEYGLMWVGRKYYTPEEFIAEDKTRGISKAIKQKPKDLVLGKTWVLLAHPKAIIEKSNPEYKKAYENWLTRGVDKIPPDPEPKPPSYPGVFYAFIPTKIEILIYESEATTIRLSELEEKRITAVVVDDKFTAHTRKTRKVRGRDNIA